MVTRRILTFIFIILMAQQYFSNAEAYDNKFVHQLINGNAIQQSIKFQNSLKYLGYQNIFELVNEKRIWQWFYDGAKEEDMPILRSFNHFHDPTKSWDKAGLDSYVVVPTLLPSVYIFLPAKGDSSIIWAQNKTQDSYLINIMNGNWSWQNARDYYYQVLTSNKKDKREKNLAYTFRALGQIMHLLADSSVPAHTRNDIHIFPFLDNREKTIPQIGTWTYETWCKYNYRKYLDTPASAVDYSITNYSQIIDLVPISNFYVWGLGSGLAI